jgi:GNAT superfamily N-acetyltransferase
MIRDARPEDLADIVALVRDLAAYERAPDAVELDPDEFARHVFGEDAVAHVLIADMDNGSVGGFAVWYRTFSTWVGRDGIWLEDLFVRPEHRRSGLGRELLDAVRARTDGRVEWAVLDWNTPAQDFYRSIGARPLDDWTVWRWPAITRRAARADTD